MLYNGQQLWCPPPINGCNEVANNSYARIFNLPVGYFGVVYYLYMLCLAALLAYDPFSRGLRLAAIVYSAIGVGFSIYFWRDEDVTPFALRPSVSPTQRESGDQRRNGYDTSWGRPAYAVSGVAYFADTAGKKPSEENSHRGHNTDFRPQHCPIGKWRYPEESRDSEKQTPN